MLGLWRIRYTVASTLHNIYIDHIFIDDLATIDPLDVSSIVRNARRNVTGTVNVQLLVREREQHLFCSILAS
jgi:hypothetical protein